MYVVVQLPCREQNIVHCVAALCSVYCVLCIVYCVLWRVHCALCIVHCALCSCAAVQRVVVGAHGWLVTSGPQSFSYLSHLLSSSSSSSLSSWNVPILGKRNLSIHQPNGGWVINTEYHQSEKKGALSSARPRFTKRLANQSLLVTCRKCQRQIYIAEISAKSKT